MHQTASTIVLFSECDQMPREYAPSDQHREDR